MIVWENVCPHISTSDVSIQPLARDLIGLNSLARDLIGLEILGSISDVCQAESK